MDGQDQIFLKIMLEMRYKFSHILGMTSLCNISGPINSMACSSLIRNISLLKTKYLNRSFNRYTTDEKIRYTTGVALRRHLTPSNV